jgi:adenylate kinase
VRWNKYKVHIVILGAPGAGKGTQAEIIHQKMNLAHVSTGDLFRQALDSGAELGLLVKDYMEKGNLVPDEIVTEMVLQRINHPDCISGWLLEGFPRTLQQAEMLDKALAEQGEEVDNAVYVEVPEEELIKRLSGRWTCRSCQAPYHMVSSPPKVEGKCDKCGGDLYQRLDDNEQTVKERLKAFNEMTIPTLCYYKKQNKLLKVDGNKEIQEVTSEIYSGLEKINKW